MRKTTLLLVALVMTATIALAEPYFVMFDAQNYVIGISVFGYADPRYHPEPVACEIPIDINCGCYQYLGGRFILDEAKHQIWLAENAVATGTGTGN